MTKKEIMQMYHIKTDEELCRLIERGIEYIVLNTMYDMMQLNFEEDSEEENTTNKDIS